MQVSELTTLREAWEGARGCYKVLGWAREDARKEGRSPVRVDWEGPQRCHSDGTLLKGLQGV